MTVAERKGAAIVNAVLAAGPGLGARTAGEGAEAEAEIVANLDHRIEEGETGMIEAGADVPGHDPVIEIETADAAAGRAIVAGALDPAHGTVTVVVDIKLHLAAHLVPAAGQGLMAHIMWRHPPC